MLTKIIDSKKKKICISNSFNIYNGSGNDVKLKLKGKSDFKYPFNNYRAYIQSAFYYRNKKYDMNCFISHKDITLENKNLGSIKLGFLKTFKLIKSENILDNNNEAYNSLLYSLKQNIDNILHFNNNNKNKITNNFFSESDISLGFKLDRSLYGRCTSNSFSNRDFINFIFGIENSKFSYLSKLKYNDFDTNTLIWKNYLKFKVDENCVILADNYHDKKNNIRKYNIGAEYFSLKDNYKIKFNFNEKNEIYQEITTKFNDNINLNFKYCSLLNDTFSNPTENLNPDLFFKCRFGIGMEFNFEHNLNQYNDNKNNYSKQKNESNSLTNTIFSLYESLKDFIKRIDFY